MIPIIFILVGASFAVGLTIGLAVNLNTTKDCRWCQNAHYKQNHEELIREYGK